MCFFFCIFAISERILEFLSKVRRLRVAGLLESAWLLGISVLLFYTSTLETATLSVIQLSWIDVNIDSGSIKCLRSWEGIVLLI